MKTRPAFEIAGVAVAPGTRRTVDIPVSVLSDHTPVTMSCHVVHGRREGPTVFVSAGIHGDEIIGVEIVRRLLRWPRIGALRGTLICIPIVNAFGFLNHSRYLPDRRDLNRCFPGNEAGSLASRLAHLFLDQIVFRSDLGIDLHSAAIHRTNLPQVRVSRRNAETLRLAKVFGAPVVLRAELREGSLRGEARKRGVNILLYEAGEALRFDENAVRIGVLGILRVLRDQGMVPAKSVAPARSGPLVCQSSRWIRSPMGGLLRSFRSASQSVEEGEVLAAVSDPFGEHETEVTASLSGVIIGRTVMPIVNEGDALFHIARIGPSDDAEETVARLATQAEDEPLFDEDEII